MFLMFLYQRSGGTLKGHLYYLFIYFYFFRSADTEYRRVLAHLKHRVGRPSGANAIHSSLQYTIMKIGKIKSGKSAGCEVKTVDKYHPLMEFITFSEKPSQKLEKRNN